MSPIRQKSPLGSLNECTGDPKGGRERRQIPARQFPSPPSTILTVDEVHAKPVRCNPSQISEKSAQDGWGFA